MTMRARCSANARGSAWQSSRARCRAWWSRWAGRAAKSGWMVSARWCHPPHRPVSWTPRAVAMHGAVRCCSAWSGAGPWCSAPGWAIDWARSRLLHAARRTTRSISTPPRWCPDGAAIATDIKKPGAMHRVGYDSRGWVSGFLTRREGPRSLGVERGLCSRGSRCLLCGGLFGGSCFLGRGRSLLGGSGCLLRRGRSLLRRSRSLLGGSGWLLRRGRSLLRRSRSLLGGSGCLLRRGRSLLRRSRSLLRRSRSLLGGSGCLLRRGRSLLRRSRSLLRRGRSLLGGCSGLLRRGRSLLGGCSGLLRRSSSLFSGSRYFFSRCCGLFGGRSLLRGGGLLGGRVFRSCHHFLLGSVGKEHSTPALGKERFMEMGFVPSP